MRPVGYWLLGALGVLAGVLFNVWFQPFGDPPPAPPPSAGQRVNYALHDFTARYFDADGRLALEVRGPLLEHTAKSRTARIESPAFVIGGSERRWTGASDVAWIDRDADRLRLLGNVSARTEHRRGTITVRSQEAHYSHVDAVLHTPGPAHIEQAGTELTGGTLTLWIDDEHMELSEDVHAIYRRGAAGDRPGR